MDREVEIVERQDAIGIPLADAAKGGERGA
jgi:hypothetical protein